MKKLYAIGYLLIFSSLMAMAQVVPDGFYRVMNYGLYEDGNTKGVREKAYIFVSDNVPPEVNKQAGTAQKMEQVGIWAESDWSPISAPSTVIYSRFKKGDVYDFEAQGTSVSKLVSFDVHVHKLGFGDNLFELSIDYVGTHYLYTTTEKTYNHYVSSTAAPADKNEYMRYWQAKPISSSSADNYFGFTPMPQPVEGKYYAPFYASFAFKFASPGMKAYYVSGVTSDQILLSPIEEELLPANTPMIIECSSPNATDNRVDLYNQSGNKISDNLLSGVFFCNDFVAATSSPKCRTQFDASTMKVWHVKNGELVLDNDTTGLHKRVMESPTSKKRYLKANESYLDLAALSGKVPADILNKAMAASSLRATDATGINEITLSDEEIGNKSYYTADGKRTTGLHKGLNIIRYGNGSVRKIILP